MLALECLRAASALNNDSRVRERVDLLQPAVKEYVSSENVSDKLKLFFENEPLLNTPIPTTPETVENQGPSL